MSADRDRGGSAFRAGRPHRSTKSDDVWARMAWLECLCPEGLVPRCWWWHPKEGAGPGIPFVSGAAFVANAGLFVTSIPRPGGKKLVGAVSFGVASNRDCNRSSIHSPRVTRSVAYPTAVGMTVPIICRKKVRMIT